MQKDVLGQRDGEIPAMEGQLDYKDITQRLSIKAARKTIAVEGQVEVFRLFRAGRTGSEQFMTVLRGRGRSES